MSVAMTWLQLLVVPVFLAAGMGLERLRLQWAARKQNSRCSWCNAKRDRPRQAVCNACLETVRPLRERQTFPEDAMADLDA